jgi:hypothetical protein
MPKGDKQEMVIDAALEVFREKGFANARMADIARRAGVSYGLVLQLDLFPKRVQCTSFFVVVISGNSLMSSSEVRPLEHHLLGLLHTEEEVPEEPTDLPDRQGDLSPRCSLKRARLPFLTGCFFLTASLASLLSVHRSA